jgi:hypothetical protein
MDVPWLSTCSRCAPFKAVNSLTSARGHSWPTSEVGEGPLLEHDEELRTEAPCRMLYSFVAGARNTRYRLACFSGHTHSPPEADRCWNRANRSVATEFAASHHSGLTGTSSLIAKRTVALTMALYLNLRFV